MVSKRYYNINLDDSAIGTLSMGGFLQLLFVECRFSQKPSKLSSNDYWYH